MFLVVRDRKKSNKNNNVNKDIVVNPRDKKIALIIVLSTMLIYYIIGYIFKTDILNAITLRKNGVNFSFIGIVLLFITSIVVGNIIDFTRKSRERNQNQ
jgi:ABC-type Mn2+/Zn2+ transport system permease subunit